MTASCSCFNSKSDGYNTLLPPPFYYSCDDKLNEYDLLCFVPPSIDVSSYYRHNHDGELVSVELALTPQEAESVRSEDTRLNSSHVSQSRMPSSA